MNSTILGLIVVPVVLFLLGAAYGGIRGSIRFAQYLVRSEEAQERSADALKTIDQRLEAYMKKTDGELRNVDRRVSIIEFALDPRPPNRSGRGE